MKSLRLGKLALAFASSTLALSCPTAGWAQASAASEAEQQGGLGEIVVTATKRETFLQDTPLAVSAIGGDAIDSRGIRDLQELSVSQPSLVMGTDAAFGFNASIRGIDSSASGIGTDTPVAFYVDGVYLGRNAGGVFGLANIERIEVLRGPQGTLFGRNATAGAVHIITKTPGDKTEFFGEAEYGNFSHIRVRASAQAPISDNLSFLIAGYHQQAKSFSHNNAFTGENMEPVRDTNIRATLAYRPSPATEIVFRADYGVSEPDAWRPDVVTKPGYVGTAADASIDNISATLPYIDDIAVNDDEYIRRRQGGFALTVEQDLSDTLQLTSISAWRKSYATFLIDSDGTTAVGQRSWLNFEHQNQISQELRLTSNNDGWFNWLLGGYYFREKANTRFYADRFNLPVPDQIGFRPFNKTEALAAFGELTLAVSDSLTIRPGLRYSRETKTFSNVMVRDLSPDPTRGVPRQLPFDETLRQTTEKTWTDWSPKISIDYHLNDDIMIYALAQKGFKSGGNNHTAADLVGNPTFDPEKVWSYEAGIRSDLFDRRLRINITGFYMDYKSLQVRAPSLTAGVAVYRNASDAVVKGLEFEALLRPIDGLTLQGAFTLLDGTYENYDFFATSAAGCLGGAFDAAQSLCSYSGNRLQRAPKLKSTVGATYVADIGIGELETNLTWSHTGRNFYDDRNMLGTKAYDIVDAFVSLSVADSPWSFRAWMKNMTDERYYAHLNPLGSAIVAHANWPRTYGLTASFRY